MTDIENLEISISALTAYNIEPNIIKDMLKKLDNIKSQLTKVSRVELPVILQITEIIDGLADEYSNEQKLAYMGNDQKTIRENDIKINTLMELKRIIAKSNLSK